MITIQVNLTEYDREAFRDMLTVYREIIGIAAPTLATGTAPVGTAEKRGPNETRLLLITGQKRMRLSQDAIAAGMSREDYAAMELQRVGAEIDSGTYAGTGATETGTDIPELTPEEIDVNAFADFGG